MTMKEGCQNMELMNCRNCKKLFNYIAGDKICPACKDALEEKYQEVKQYIKDNPGTAATVVAEECEVSIKQIKKWVREERLVFAEDSLIGIECEKCGKQIHSGRFCAACAVGIESGLRDAYKVQYTGGTKKRDSGKMRFLE
jgi:predicted amidophosphoribosyltransferase